jgi:hypothetical protein
MRQKFQQTVITLFDTETMVSGVNGANHGLDNELANWQEFVPGSYTFPFALKVPNINFPPCIPVSLCFFLVWLGYGFGVRGTVFFVLLGDTIFVLGLRKMRERASLRILVHLAADKPNEQQQSSFEIARRWLIRFTNH